VGEKYETTTQQVVDALIGAYANAVRVPLYPDDCIEGHRAGVRDCAVRLGVYDEFVETMDVQKEGGK
jgi:hypothetical protein